jgi:Xaa-Pro dipeptidase
VNNAGEIDRFRRVNEIAAFALAAFARSVEPGRSGIEIAAAVEAAALLEGTGYRGARRVRAFAQVAVGREETAIGYRPMEITTRRRLAEGEWALLELAVVADGYWSDRTRLRCAGNPDADAAARFELVRRAPAAAVAAVRPGVTAGEIDHAAREVLREGGYVEEFLHVTGHGIGWRYHEPTPLIAPKETTVLREGMIHSVEPGIYRSDFGGFRIEDDVVVTNTGAEVLGPSPVEWE